MTRGEDVLLSLLRPNVANILKRETGYYKLFLALLGRGHLELQGETFFKMREILDELEIEYTHTYIKGSRSNRFSEEYIILNRVKEVSSGFKFGDKVIHNTYGLGVVIDPITTPSMILVSFKEVTEFGREVLVLRDSIKDSIEC